MLTKVITHSQRKGQEMIFRGARFVATVVEKVKFEIIAADDRGHRLHCQRTECKEDCRIAIRPYQEVT